MVNNNEGKPISLSKETSIHIPSDAKLKIAELNKLQAEQAKLNAEAMEINKRLNQPWWYVRPSAFLQILIAGIIGGFLSFGFTLTLLADTFAISDGVKKYLNKEETRIGQENNTVTQDLAETLQAKSALQNEIAAVQQNLSAIAESQPDIPQRENITAAQDRVDALKETISTLEESSSNLQEGTNELNDLIKSKLEGFKILIRHSPGQAKSNALEIKSILENIGLDNVEVREISVSDMNNRWSAKNNQIRYFELTEKTEATILQEKIQISSDIKIRLQDADTESPDFLSIFLP